MADQRPLEGLRIALDARYVRMPGLGITRYLLGLIPALSEAGAEITLMTNFDPAPYVELFPSLQWRAFGHRIQTVWEQVSVPKFLRANQFDLVWYPASMGTPLAPTGRTLTLTTVHDLVWFRFPVEYLVRDPLFALPFSLWIFGALFRSDIVFTVSDASARDIRRFSRRRAVVVAPTLGTAVLTDPTTEEASDLPDGRYIAYNGGLEKRKCVPEMLRGVAAAFAVEQDLRLVLMGGSAAALEPQLEELGIRERCILTGYVSEGRKTALLRNATALIYTSKFEGYGIPLVEALAAGIPILAANNSSIPEIVGDAAVLIESISSDEIATGILDVAAADTQQRLRIAAPRRYDELKAELSGAALVTALRDAIMSKGDRRTRAH